jgi:hypothetical protein
MRERGRTRRNGSRPPPQRNEYFANASAVDRAAYIEGCRLARQREGTHDQSRQFGGAIFTRPTQGHRDDVPGGLRVSRQ